MWWRSLHDKLREWMYIDVAPDFGGCKIHRFCMTFRHKWILRKEVSGVPTGFCGRCERWFTIYDGNT